MHIAVAFALRIGIQYAGAEISSIFFFDNERTFFNTMTSGHNTVSVDKLMIIL